MFLPLPKYSIAIAQIDSILGDVKRNVAKHVEFVRRAKDGGADIVVFPELSLSGYSVKDLNWDVAISLHDPSVLEPLMKESADIGILVGGVEEADDLGIYNSAFFIEHGIVSCAHRKVYLPTYGMFEEMRYFSPGSVVRTVETHVGKLGVLICEDLWHPALPYLMAHQGAQVIIGMAASPTRLNARKDMLQVAEVNLEHHRSYARLFSVYVLFSNRVGFEDGVNFWGGSEAVAPSGAVLVQAKHFDEDLIFADIELNELRRARRFSRHFLDDDPHLVARELRRINRQGDHS